MPSERLKTSTKLLYGLGDVGNAIVNSAVQFYLLIFYTDAALVGPALAANALMLGKAWDAVNDPLFGWLSDRTQSRLGKRRVYMLLGALPLAVAIALLWRVPQGLSQAALFAWIAGTFILFDTFWTLTNVPYYALTAELTDDYDERSSLTTFRMVLGVPAYMIGAALTPALVALFATQRTGYGVVGIVYGLLAAAALWIAAAGLHERPSVSETPAQDPVLKSFAGAFRNRPFVQLVAAYMVANTAFALVKTLLAYYLTYQLNMGAQVTLVMFILLACVALALFPWKWLAGRWSKGPTYALGLAIGGAAVAATFFLPHKPTFWIYPIAAIAGIGFSANWVFPWAMVPDVVDHDELTSGEKRGGMYYGVWGLTLKISEALGLAASGWILELYGYVPNVEQSARTLQGLRLFFGPVSGLFIALSLPLLIWYPITRARHAAIRAQIDARSAATVERA
ncbi:MAG: MFS transporter [Chloroflexi bacterium]|nr:MFS transporter [Chloroflexota bacterium]